MARRGLWNPTTKIEFEMVRETEFIESLAELGKLIYDHFRSRQLQDQSDPSIATSHYDIASSTTRKAGCE